MDGGIKACGRYLPIHRRQQRNRWICITLLAAWDGLLLYMVAGCLIEPVYGTVFAIVVSVFLGYQL